MTTISAKTILRSRNMAAVVSTLLLRYPRPIHAEFMTHRVFSRNAASSRAIPIAKLIAEASNDSAVPLHWGLNERGMQATTQLTGENLAYVQLEWHAARKDAIRRAKNMAARNASKQLVNRILEPFTNITVVVTSSNWSNFLALRDHSDAEPHIQILAREVRKCLENDPIQDLHPGQWHLPFVTGDVDLYDQECVPGDTPKSWINISLEDQIKLSVARCASTSYKTVDGFDMTLERAIELHDRLLAASPLHASPAEHQCQADIWNDEYQEWELPGMGGNLGDGWIQYRKTLPGECQ